MDEIVRCLCNVHVQLDSRAAEIDRLTKLLDGGRPHDVVALEARNRSNERLISHLNIQVTYADRVTALFLLLQYHIAIDWKFKDTEVLPENERFTSCFFLNYLFQQ